MPDDTIYTTVIEGPQEVIYTTVIEAGIVGMQPNAAEVPLATAIPGISAMTVQGTLEEILSDVGLAYVTLATAQTIPGQKTFKSQPVFSGDAGLAMQAMWQRGSLTRGTVGFDATNDLFTVQAFGTNNRLNLRAPAGSGGVFISADAGVTTHISVLSGSGTVVTAPGAAIPALVAKGAAGQTSPLQQWQDSAGSTLARVAASGALHARPASAARTAAVPDYNLMGTGGGTWPGLLVDDSFYTYAIGQGGFTAQNGNSWQLYRNSSITYYENTSGAHIFKTTAGFVPLVAQGAVSQTADLQQWQDSTGAILSSVSSAGLFLTRSGSYFGDNNLNSFLIRQGSSPNNRLRTAAAGHIGLVVQGSAAQTADLQQWHDSAAAVLARIRSDGGLAVPEIRLDNLAFARIGVESSSGFPWISYSGEYEAGAVTTSSAGSPSLISLSNVGIRFHTGSALAVGNAIPERMRIAADGTISIAQGVAFANASDNGDQFYFSGTSLILSMATAADIPLVVRGKAAQTGDLQQWQNSAATVLSLFDNNGNLIVRKDIWGAGGALVAGLNTPSARIGNAGGTTEVRLGVQGTAGQTNDLQQWLTSGGTVLASMSATGRLSGASWQIDGANSRAMIGNATNIVGETFGVQTLASRIGFFLKGAAGQTVDLQQWADASNVVMASVTKDGEFFTAKGMGIGTAVPSSLSLLVTPRSSSFVAAVVRGAVSQTADLQQWQDSAGAVLAFVRNDGAMATNYLIGRNYVNGFPYINMVSASPSAPIQIVSGTASGAVLAISGVASQTGDLQQWRDSTGAKIAFAAANGELWSSTGFYVGTGSTTSYAIHASANPGTRLQASGATITPLMVKGAAAQTGDLIKFHDSSANALARFASNGGLELGTSGLTINNGELAVSGVARIGTAGGGYTFIGPTAITTTHASGIYVAGAAGKLGFYGATPIVRPVLPAAGVVTADDIRNALINLGLAA